MAHHQLGYDLAAHGVTDERRALQTDLAHPGREGVGESCHVEDAGRTLAPAEAGQVGHENSVMGSQQLGGWDNVTARDDEPVHPHHRGAPLRRRFSGGTGVHPYAASPGPYRLEFLLLPDGIRLPYALRLETHSGSFYDLPRKAPNNAIAVPAAATRFSVGCL